MNWLLLKNKIKKQLCKTANTVYCCWINCLLRIITDDGNKQLFHLLKKNRFIQEGFWKFEWWRLYEKHNKNQSATKCSQIKMIFYCANILMPTLECFDAAERMDRRASSM